MSTTTTPTPAEAQQPDPAPTGTTTPETASDAPLGEPGLRALQAERERGNRLEAELRELKPIKAQMDALRAAFGPSDAPDDDIVGTLQQQVAAMQKDSLVNSMARRHGITEESDVDLLRSAPDEAAMARLAERLKATAAGTTPAPNAPAPDPSQGTQLPSQEVLEDAQYAHFYPNSK